MYYDYHDLLTRNGLYSFIIGSRGAGKTFGWKKWAISSFLKTEKQFVYLRRYKTEIKALNGNFFNDVAPFFPNVEFEQKGTKLYINKKLAGYLVSLSNSLIMKSVDLKQVDKIAFDEFVIDKGNLRYLENEPIKFLELYETIARMRPKKDEDGNPILTKDGEPTFEEPRAFFISNAVSVTNPYFLFWDVRPRKGERFTFAKDGTLVIEFVQNDDFKDMKYKTRFGQLIKGTTYGDYAIENKFLVDSDTFVEKRSEKAKYICKVKYLDNYYGFWLDYSEGKFYVSDKYDPDGRITYALTTSDHEPNLLLVRSKKKGIWLQQFIEAYEKGYCYFESVLIKNQAMEIFRLLKS